MKHLTNVRVEQLGEGYTDLSFFGKQRFDKIICLSVIQYYRAKDDMKDLMAAVKKITAPGARFIIADISIENGLIADIVSLVRSAFRERMFFEAIKLLGQRSSGSMRV